MTEQAKTKKKPTEVTVGRAKGRPMLSWVGKKPLGRVTAFPAQHIERFSADDAAHPLATSSADWSKWPKDLPQGGLLYHGDNKEVLAHLLANGFRGQVKLIYIDPPFDSGADYVRKVHLRGPQGKVKIEGEDYALGEQVQYTDIWSNDNYLQFMYERLLMLKELLTPDGAIYLHCDPSRNSYLRLIMDEVFGQDNFVNEIVWHYYNKMQGNIGRFASNHDVILSYRNGERLDFTTIREARDKPKTQQKRVWDSETQSLKQARDEQGNLIYYEDTERTIDDVWRLPYLMPADQSEKLDYPTQKPERLIDRIIRSSSQEGDLVLDCFIGSGTTAAVAQRLGRRWIGCDINKGAIQTTAKRLQGVMRDQSRSLSAVTQGELVDKVGAKLAPRQLGFSIWRVNDYDLHIQHNEAVELACEHLSITRTRTDPYFDGTRGKMLVKIIPLNHPLTPLDLEALRTELKNRPDEERDLLVVSLGQEYKAREWVEHYNHNRPINKIHLIELRTDRKAGGFIKHEPMSVQASAQRKDDKLIVTIADVVSPSIIARLDLQDGIFRAQIPDWRAVVDCVLIDANHDGDVFNVTIADVPERKKDFVNGRYELRTETAGEVVALKVIDMLGEERIVLLKPEK
ncbi:site-specific DNA-methyltransferase [uncultured Delftia sp.]|uniref:site-specific DNA-methyltransferase n=1 Tax=uncultured Delftia sp. TaxID=191464 RepID=UPI000691C0BD|nr:site-specific DNA-methyltransferase [uncultured Delftia sp.]